LSPETSHAPACAKRATHRHYPPGMPQTASSALADVFAFKGERANPNQ
jgi:hypothetical protein